jgi:HTH-type transcriptional regulator / antitoxin HigA
MSAAVAAASDYKQLIAEFPPKVIRSEEENRFYLDKLTEMTYRWDALTPQERDLYETLKILIADFEEKTYKIPEATPIEVIQELLKANGLMQKDLVGIFPTESVVSEVLKGNRPLRVEHIRKLSERFNVSPSVFFYSGRG